jgi:hypothetical protein
VNGSIVVGKPEEKLVEDMRAGGMITLRCVLEK